MDCKELETLDRRDERTALINGIGASGMRALHDARVLVVGAGGLGSPVLTYLAAASVGTLGVADGDRVEISNLQRQFVHDADRIGSSKSDSAKHYLQRFHPGVRVQTYGFLDLEEATRLARDDYDIIVDATDRFDSKYIVSDAAKAAGKPCVWGSIIALEYQVSVFTPESGLSLRSLYPTPPAGGMTPASTEVGVLGAACGQAGSLMATEVIKLITGIGQPLLGRVVLGDALNASWNTVTFAKV